MEEVQMCIVSASLFFAFLSFVILLYPVLVVV
jgi:hypothetical protein